MTVLKLKSTLSDDTEDMVSLPPEEELYRRKYHLLLERCEVLQQDNERILNRILEVKSITRRRRRDIILLIARLEQHTDSLREEPATDEVYDNKKHVKEESERLVKLPAAKQSEKLSTSAKKTATKRKTKAEKPEKDPNAPKKPCNAFFQYCQEQRPLVVAEISQEPGDEPSKQEITRRLALRWRSLPDDKKSIYVAMFERSKEKYVEEMSAYVKKDQ